MPSTKRKINKKRRSLKKRTRLVLTGGIVEQLKQQKETGGPVSEVEKKHIIVQTTKPIEYESRPRSATIYAPIDFKTTAALAASKNIQLTNTASRITRHNIGAEPPKYRPIITSSKTPTENWDKLRTTVQAVSKFRRQFEDPNLEKYSGDINNLFKEVDAKLKQKNPELHAKLMEQNAAEELRKQQEAAEIQKKQAEIDYKKELNKWGLNIDNIKPGYELNTTSGIVRRIKPNLNVTQSSFA